MAIKTADTPLSTASPPTSLQSLSLPAATFAKLSPAPYLLAHLQPSNPHTPSHRPSGRTPSDFRPPTAHTGSLTHASGSAVVRVGDTAVVCGVRGEILLASDIPQPPLPPSGHDGEESEGNELAELGLLVPNLELATGCSPAHLPGNPPSVLAQSLTQRILTLLHTARLIGLEDLRIWHQPPDTATDGEDDEPHKPVVKAYWTLYIDILFISLDGNPFDAAWGAVMAALRDTLLPHAWWDIDRAAILCDDAVSKARKLSLRAWPVASTFAVFEPRAQLGIGAAKDKGREKKAWVLADPDSFEEGLCRETVTVVVDVEGGRTKILAVEKVGGGVVGVAEMRTIFGMAEARWREWKGVLGS